MRVATTVHVVVTMVKDAAMAAVPVHPAAKSVVTVAPSASR